MTDNTVTISLSGAPRGKGRPRFRAVTTKDGRRFNSAYTDDLTEKYEAALRSRAQDAMNGRPPLMGPLRARIFAVFPIPASWSQKKQQRAIVGSIRPIVRPDLDNIFKDLDALNQVVFKDDSQIVETIIRKIYGDRPRLEVVIEPVPMPAPSETKEVNEVWPRLLTGQLL